MSETTESDPGIGSHSEALVRGESSEVSSPIFLVGCHRSGTSLLRQLLDSHPRISAGPEDPVLYNMSLLDHDGWRTTLGKYGFTEDEWLSKMKAIFEELHCRYAASQGKTRWAEKCPENSRIVGFLDRLYPNCQVVHIVRNPRDVIASNREKFGKKKGAFYGRRWVQYVRSAELGGAQLGCDRFRTIRYEDLVKNPEEVLRDLIEWLGEAWSPDVLRFRERTHQFPPRWLKTRYEEKSAIHTGSIGRGRAAGSILPLLYVHLRGRDLLRRFGY
ncbi:MAG: sulfotransferase family protein [Acidimicrobiales bacterium]